MTYVQRHTLLKVEIVKEKTEMDDEINTVNFRLDSSNFNIDNGYLEGIVRGFKSGILTQADYSNLTQCQTLDGTYTYNISATAFELIDRVKVLRPIRHTVGHFGDVLSSQSLSN